MPESVSVVIPTCDRPGLLPLAVRSALEQTHAPCEILVIDNGREEVVAGTLPEAVRIVRLPARCGVSRARNAGAEEARGTWVAFLDDDDLWAADYLEEAVRGLAASDAAMGVGSVEIFEGDGPPQPWKSAEGQVGPEVLLVRNPGIVGSNTVVRRERFLAVGGYDETLTVSEDKGLALDMLGAGLTVTCIPSARALQRRHGAHRLTDSGDMAEGLGRFVAKYRDRMTPGQYRYNRYKMAMHRYRQHKSIPNLIGYAWARILAPKQ